MKKFIAIYHSAPEAMSQMANATPEQKAAAMEPWIAWQKKSGDAIVDMGAPLAGGITGTADKKWSTSTKQVSGYSIVQGESLEAVKALFVNHPHLNWHSSSTVEIHEALAM